MLQSEVNSHQFRFREPLHSLYICTIPHLRCLKVNSSTMTRSRNAQANPSELADVTLQDGLALAGASEDDGSQSGDLNP